MAVFHWSSDNSGKPTAKSHTVRQSRPRRSACKQIERLEERWALASDLASAHLQVARDFSVHSTAALRAHVSLDILSGPKSEAHILAADAISLRFIRDSALTAVRGTHSAVRLNNLVVGSNSARLNTSAEVQNLINEIRAVETFSNPNNPGQIVAALRPDAYPDPKAPNDRAAATTGTFGLDAYSRDGRNTPGAFQVDLANLNNVFGIWRGKAETAKNTSPYDTQIAFSKDTLAQYFDVQVNANGLITSIGSAAASVFLHNESIALDKSFNPTQNALIGQNINNFQTEQLSLYLAGRSPEDPNTIMQDDPRVAPIPVIDAATALQDQVARTFIWNSYNAYLTKDLYKQTFDEAEQLFGSEMRIKASTSAFGIKAGQTFLCKFDPGFIIGGGYVRGFNAGGMWDIIQAVVQANKNGEASYTITDKQGLKTITITRTEEGGKKIFSVDKTPINVSEEYPSIYHYGGVVSPFDVNMANQADWGVSSQPFTLGYSQTQTQVSVSDTETAPSGNGPYNVAYSNLAADKTLTIGGGDTYWVAPTQSDPVSKPIQVDNNGYNNPANNSQMVNPGQKIDMSAYGTTMANAYHNFFYVYTKSGKDVVKHVSDPAVPTDVPLRMYYIPAANGSLEKAQKAIDLGDFSKWSDYKDSYRVLLSNLAVLGTPTNADRWGQHFLMTPPTPAPAGTGVLDASSATGSLTLQVDGSINQVNLGSGPNLVERGDFNGRVTFVLNASMSSGTANTTFSGLVLGTDVLSLKRFVDVKDVQIIDGSTFDNKSNSPAISGYYEQYSKSALVKFTAGAPGATRTYEFQVLDESESNITPKELNKQILASISRN